MMLWLSITLLALGIFGATILRRHLRETKLLRVREISHKERMAAMERDLPIPETDPANIESLLAGGEGAGAGPDRTSRASGQWVRLTALAVGLTCLFGGAGTMPALYYQADAEASGVWPIGLIPVFIGTGLLIFVLLSRGLTEKLNGK